MRAWLVYALEWALLGLATMFVALGLGSIARWITERVMKRKG